MFKKNFLKNLTFVTKEFQDPFESKKIIHYEVINIEDVLYYPRRTMEPKYEVFGTIYRFCVRDEKIINGNLDLIEYIRLLSEKDEETKKEFFYSERSGLLSFADDLMKLEKRMKEQLEIKTKETDEAALWQVLDSCANCLNE